MERHEGDSQGTIRPIEELCQRFSDSLNSFSSNAIGSAKFRSEWRAFRTDVRNRIEDIINPERRKILGVLEGTKKEIDKRTSPGSVDEILSKIQVECTNLLGEFNEQKRKGGVSKIEPQEQIWKNLKPAEIPTRLKVAMESFTRLENEPIDLLRIEYICKEVLFGLEYYNGSIGIEKYRLLSDRFDEFISGIDHLCKQSNFSQVDILLTYRNRAEKLREKSLDVIRMNEYKMIGEKELEILRAMPFKDVLAQFNRYGITIRESLIKKDSIESQFEGYFRVLSVCEEKVHNMPFFKERVLLEVQRMMDVLHDSPEHSVRYQRLLAYLQHADGTIETPVQAMITSGDSTVTPAEHHEERFVEKTMIRSARKNPETIEQAQIKRLSTGVRDAFDAYTNTILSFIDNEEHRDSLLARNAQTEKVTTTLKNFLNSILSFRGRLENTFCKKHLRKVLDQLEAFDRECMELLRVRGMGKKVIFYNLLISYISGWKKLFISPEIADIERTDRIYNKRESTRGHGRQPHIRIVKPRIIKPKVATESEATQEGVTPSLQKPVKNTKKLGNPVLTEEEWLQIKDIWSRLPHARFDDVGSILDLELFLDEANRAKDLLGIRKRKTNIKDPEVDTIGRSIRYIVSELKKQLKKQLDKIQKIENYKKNPAEGQNKTRSPLRDIEAKIEPFVIRYHEALKAFNSSSRSSKKSEQHIRKVQNFLEVLITCIKYWNSEKITRLHTSTITCKIGEKNIKYTIPSLQTLEEKKSICEDRLLQLGINMAETEGI